MGLDGPLPPGGRGQARRRLVRRLHAAGREARHGDRRRVRPRLPRRRGDGTAQERPPGLRDGSRLAVRGGGASQPAASPARARAQRHARRTSCSTRRRAPSCSRAPGTRRRSCWTGRVAARTSRCPDRCRWARCASPTTRTSRRGSSRVRRSCSTPMAWSSAPASSLDVGLERLREAVCRTDREPEAMCDAIIRAMLPGGATHDDAALLVGARAAALRPARAAPPGRRGHHPVAQAGARTLAARGRRLVERDRGDHARLLGGLRQRDRACLRAGPGCARGHRLGLAGRRDRHLRARLRQLASGAGRPPGPRDGPDEGSDGLRRRGLRRRRHHGPARPAARGPALEPPTRSSASPIAARFPWPISAASSTCPPRAR